MLLVTPHNRQGTVLYVEVGVPGGTHSEVQAAVCGVPVKE